MGSDGKAGISEADDGHCWRMARDYLRDVPLGARELQCSMAVRLSISSGADFESRSVTPEHSNPHAKSALPLAAGLSAARSHPVPSRVVAGSTPRNGEHAAAPRDSDDPVRVLSRGPRE